VQDVPWRDAGGALLLLAQLRVRGGGWVDGQAACVAQVRHVVEQLQGGDELGAGRLAAAQLEALTNTVVSWEAR